MVDLIHLYSNNSTLPLTPVELRALMEPGRPTGARRTVVAHSVSMRLGPERCDEIVRRYQAGETAKALGDEFGVSKNAVLNLLRANRVVVRRRSLTDGQIRRLISGYEAETGIPHGTIQRALSRAGVQMRPRGLANGGR